ncbi:nucleoside deaminase [Salisediminibacterium halotolerans]|uniref:tRNA(Arg) A34 adenosine deaminase TadA n=1 Tax=Salisediminibacterium halotolerans TaxID=517425 RepID=A0A1H9SWH4_9BACI|nr:nucleoside deaminase [Salisediminibacterium haloalkalitolerans]SER88723.1 tRNA(Arg) A34 adenosine deaminase TadA [Salisediminibacterium haloalkalitolerans]
MANEHEVFMKTAIDLAIEARREGNSPFGSVLVKNGEIVAEGKNEIHTRCDPTHHAEIGVIRDYCSAHHVSDLSSYTLYTSCEPCVMCAGAMVWARLGTMVYSISNQQLSEIEGGKIMIPSADVFEKSHWKPEVTAKILNEDGLRVFEDWPSKHVND